jgi:hypothetical protein
MNIRLYRSHRQLHQLGNLFVWFLGHVAQLDGGAIRLVELTHRALHPFARLPIAGRGVRRLTGGSGDLHVVDGGSVDAPLRDHVERLASRNLIEPGGEFRLPAKTSEALMNFDIDELHDVVRVVDSPRS